MQHDFSYGIIPLMQQDNNWYTIMIKLASGNHRGLPKWHPNPQETMLDTALREFYEETGLQLSEDQINTADIYTEQYEFFHPKKQNTILKTVSYYIAEIPYIDVSQLSGYSEGDGEILDKRVVSLTEAIDLATYDTTREILEKIYEKMSSNIEDKFVIGQP